jgi:ribosomal-protein-alanine N-acetyltransferase
MDDLRSEPPVFGAEFRVVDLSRGPWHPLLARFFERQTERERTEFHMGPVLLSEIESNPVARYFGVVRPAGPGLVGFLGSWFVGDEAEIHHLYLDPSFRGRGVAFRLMTRFLSYAESAGIRLVYLEVRESNRRALELYSTLGFSPSGVRPNYYQAPSEDAILMVYNSGTVEGGGTGNPSPSSGPVSIEGPLA